MVKRLRIIQETKEKCKIGKFQKYIQQLNKQITPEKLVLDIYDNNDKIEKEENKGGFKNKAKRIVN